MYSVLTNFLYPAFLKSSNHQDTHWNAAYQQYRLLPKPNPFIRLCLEQTFLHRNNSTHIKFYTKFSFVNAWDPYHIIHTDNIQHKKNHFFIVCFLRSVWEGCWFCFVFKKMFACLMKNEAEERHCLGSPASKMPQKGMQKRKIQRLSNQKQTGGVQSRNSNLRASVQIIGNHHHSFSKYLISAVSYVF